MDANATDKEFDKWFSTYGVITSERILRHYKINFSSEELLIAIKTRASFYRKLLQVPLKNVLNEIVLQQANDYHLYTQKLFVDYLLSGEGSKPPESPGAGTREQIEEERKLLVALGEEFNQLQFEHEAFISSSQKQLIDVTDQLQKQITSITHQINGVLKRNEVSVAHSITQALIHSLMSHGIITDDDHEKQAFITLLSKQLNLDESLRQEIEFILTPLFDVLIRNQPQINELLHKTHEMIDAARRYRVQFYDAALKILELIRVLPDYRLDLEQDAVNRQHLYFDKTIGERII